MAAARVEAVYLAAEACTDIRQDGGNTAIVGTPQEDHPLPHLECQGAQGILGCRRVKSGVGGRVAPQTGLHHAWNSVHKREVIDICSDQAGL